MVTQDVSRVQHSPTGLSLPVGKGLEKEDIDEIYQNIVLIKRVLIVDLNFLLFLSSLSLVISFSLV